MCLSRKKIQCIEKNYILVYTVDYKNMATKQRTIRIEEWIDSEVELIRIRKPDKEVSYSEVVNSLLESELNRMGIYKSDYQKKKLGLPNNEVETKRQAQ